jgi:hypothetical protein
MTGTPIEPSSEPAAPATDAGGPNWLAILIGAAVVAAAVIGILFLFGVFDNDEVTAPPIFIIPPESTLPPETTTTTEETTTTLEETTTTLEETTTTLEETTTTLEETTTTVEETTTTEAPTTTTEAPTTTTAPPETTTSTIPVTPTIPVAPPETILVLEEFIDLFNAAVGADDTDWLFDHLNPVVVQGYGEASCRAAIDAKIINVKGLALDGPVLGPHMTSIQVEPGTVVVLDNLYLADVSFTWFDEPQEGGAWFQISPFTTGLDTPVTYFTQCDEPTVEPR